jgi:hypothetical protein
MIVKPIRDQAWGSAYLLFALNAESKVVLVRRIRNGVGAGRRLLLIGDIHSDSQKLPGPEGLKGFAVFRFQIEGGDSFTFGHSPIQNELAPSDPGRAFFWPAGKSEKIDPIINLPIRATSKLATDRKSVSAIPQFPLLAMPW